jgi:hypothetical protein
MLGEAVMTLRTLQVVSPNRPTRKDAKELRDAGYGWEDLKVMCGLSEVEARLLVFGREAYTRRKEKAS